MLHPVGSQPPTVYWRRRLLILAPIVLIGLTIYVACSGGGSGTNAAASSSPPASASSASRPATTAPVTKPTTPATTPARTTPPASTAPATPVACKPASLKVSAGTQAPRYAIGAQPVLYLQVINIGKVPCTQDLADQQIVLLVYNGAARVWGSHDCQVVPGSSVETLTVNQPIQRTITWGGLSSQPNCVGTRQRVGAGTYTLQASLGAITGTAATFTIS